MSSISSVTGYGIFKPSYARTLSELSDQFDDLNRQLTTGLKATSYAGLGTQRDLALSINGKLNQIDGYTSNINTLNVRLDAMTTALSGISTVMDSVRGDLDPNNSGVVDGKHSAAQTSALGWLDTAVEMLNTDVAGRYLFGGRDVTTRPVVSSDTIMNGSGSQAGFLQVVNERRAADIGDGMGRLVLGAQTVGSGLDPAAATDLTNGGTAAAGFITDGNDLTITTGAGTATFTIDDAGINTLSDLADAINNDSTLDGGVTATIVNGQLRLNAGDAATSFTVGGAAATELGLASPTYDPATGVMLSEDVAGSPFGFKLGGIGTDIAGATASGPSGSPPSVSLSLAGATPVEGDTVRVQLTLPDGTTEDVTLSATNGTPVSQDTAKAQGTATLAGVQGDTVLNSAELGLAAGNTITVNGQTITIVASGATGNQVNATDTLDTLLQKIGTLDGVAGASLNSATGQIEIVGEPDTSLSITGTVATKLGVNGSFTPEPSNNWQFQIAYNADGSVDTETTSRNLSTALGSAVKETADTALVAASAMAASKDFFDIDADNPPQRVDGSNLALATSLRDATATDTVQWYQGEAGTDSARATQAARIDSTISVGYGARANEDGIWKSVGAVAAFAAVTLDGTDNAAARYQELTGRVRTAVGSESGLGPLENVVAEIAGVQSQVQAASDRHTTSKNLLLSAQDDVQGIDQSEVTAKILDLQTRLEASYQVTSMLSKLSLVNYL